MEIVNEKLSFLNADLRKKIIEQSTVKHFDAGVEVVRYGQYISSVPILLEGLVKVSSQFGEKELLLYYIESSQSCVMTFIASLDHTPSKVKAATIQKSILLLLPVSQLTIWLKDYPTFNRLFFNQYNIRYLDLLNTISNLLIDNLDKRLLEHLKKIALVTNKTYIKTSHVNLAKELGTVREVISRVLKKLEIQEELIQTKDGIKIL